MLIPLVLLILLFPISVLSQSYDCPEQKQITVEKTFTRVGEKLTIPIDLKPCEEISVDEYHQFSDPNTGTLLIFRYLNRDGETIIEQSYSATGAWRGLNFPDRAPEPFPFQASVGTKELPATLEIESSTAIGKSPSYKFTIKRSPRYNHNIGGTDFKSAKEFTTLPSTFYGSLREDDGGQFFKVRLESEESLHFSGFSEANQRYGGGMHISIYNSRTENLFPTFANGWWLYNPDYGVRRFEKTFKNPYKSAENFYIKVGSWPFHVYNFSINLSLQKNAKQKPVVFIPGIAGSTLNTKGGDTLWPVGLSTDLSDLTLDPAKRPWRTIVSNDIVRKVMGFKDVYGEFINSLRNMGGFVEYDYRRDPRLRTAEGCDLSQKSKIPELFAFPYDWRKSNKESLSSLDQYLQCVQKFYPDTKVDLVAHSMGGVLARRYIMEYGGRQNIGRLITINTPWLGAPKAINVLFTGEFFDSVFDYLFMSRIRELTEYFQGVHELIPSRWYFGLGGRPIAVEKGQGTSDLSYEEMVRYLDDRFSFSRPGTAGMSFHDVPGQDDARGDKSGKYLSIYSLQKAGTTPSKVIQEKYAKCLSLEFGFRCKEQNRYRLERSSGDGTVPIISLHRGNGKINLSSNFLRATSNSEAMDKKFEHLGFLRNPLLHRALVGILRRDEDEFSAAAASDQQEELAAVADTFEEPVEGASNIVTLRSIKQLLIEDENGNSNTQMGNVFRDVPGVSHEILGENDTELVLENGNRYRLSFINTEEPFSLELRHRTAEGHLKLIKYLDITLEPGTNLMFEVTDTGPGDLLYDSDKDGSFESTIGPTIELEGDQAKDQHPPELFVSFNPLRISVKDVSGVRRILYSTDGEEFYEYTEGEQLEKRDTIYVVAEDMALNRTGIVKYQKPD